MIYFYQPRRWELYNLADDIGEQHDLAQEQPERLLEMSAKLLTELKEKHALFPTNRDTGEAEPPVAPKRLGR